MKKIIILALSLLFSTPALAQNYQATAGSGLTFGANLVGGTLYPQMNMCDPTTPARCIVIDASGRPTVNINGTVTVSGTVAATQSGTWTVQPGNTANTTPWLTSVSQGGNTAIVKAGNTFAGTELALGVAVTNSNPNGQAALASSSPVAIAKNSGTGSTVAGAAVGTAGTASAEVVTVQGIASMTPILARPSDGTRNAVLDPCEANAQSYAPLSITSATTTRIVTPSASNKTYICGLIIVTGAANNVAIVEGTGGTCGTGTAGVIGGTTAANGSNFSANGGLVLQAGKTAHAQTAGTNVDLCVITSSVGPYAGGIKYVQAP